jgi:hypothetical protein
VKHLPIYFHGSISLREVEEALHSRGMHLRDDGRGRVLVDRIPRCLTSESLPASMALSTASNSDFNPKKTSRIVPIRKKVG